jgi:hypothetical protein
MSSNEDTGEAFTCLFIFRIGFLTLRSVDVDKVLDRIDLSICDLIVAGILVEVFLL